MRSEDKTKLDFRLLYTWGFGAYSENMLYKVVADIHPEVASRFKEVCQKLMEVDFTLEDDYQEKPVVTNLRVVRNKLCMPDEKTADEYLKHVEEFRDIWDSAMNDPKVQEYPGIRDFMGFYSKTLNRFLDGNDVATDLYNTPGGTYIMDAHVDFSTGILEKKGKKVIRKFTLEELNQKFEDLHYGEMADATLNFMEISSKLRDENLDGVEKHRIVNAIPDILTKIENVAEYQRNPATVEKVKDLYLNASLNLAGNRGSSVAISDVAQWRQCIGNGWDPSYIQDKVPIYRLANTLRGSAEWFEKTGRPEVLAPLNEKFEKIKSLDYENKKFANESEFIAFFQDYADAVKDVIEEGKKPEVKAAVSNLNNRQELNGGPFIDFTIGQGGQSKSQQSFTADYIIEHLDFKRRGIDESNLTGPRINYNFMKNAATVLSGQFSDILGSFEPVLGDAYFNDNFIEKYILLSGGCPHLDELGTSGKVLIDPYNYDNPRVYTANSLQHVKDTANDVNDLAEQYKKLLDNPDMQNFKGTCAYLSYMQKFIESAREGVDRFGYMSRVPGCNKTNGFPDFRKTDPETKRAYTPQEFDNMLLDMGFDKVWANMDKRCDLEMEMNGKTFGADQAAEYGRRITEINNDLISVYERMMSPEMEQRYSKFFEHFNGMEGTIAGKRGYVSVVNELKAENEVLAKGWDPSRLADYNVLKKLSESCRDSLDLFTQIGDPELNNVEKYMRRIASLNPSERKFPGREGLDAYLIQYSMALKDLASEIDKPEIQTKLSGHAEKNGIDGKYAFAAVVKKEKMPGVYEIVHEMAKKTDISSELITDFTRERAAEVAQGKTDAKIYRCAETVEDIARQAQEKLNDFTNRLDIQRKKNSGFYNDMRSALEGVSKLSRSNSVEEVNEALDNLEKASEIYKKERSSFFKTDKGQSRLDAAADLINFAKGKKTELSKDVQGTNIEKHQDVKLDELFDKSLRGARVIADNIDAAMSFDSTSAMDLQEGFSRGIKMRPNMGLNEFTNTLSKIIAQKVIDIGIQKKTFTSDTAPSMVQYAAGVSQNEHFQNWAKTIYEDTKQREQLAQMSPGEVYAKYATSRQKEFLKENNPRQMAPAAKLKMEKSAAPKPQETKPHAPGR